jgi:hypothetical protein
MKFFNVFFKFLLIASLVGFFTTSCSKEDEDDKDEEFKEEEKEEVINFHVDVTNFRGETIYFFVEDGTTKSILSGNVLTWDLSHKSQTGYVKVGVKLANGEILDQKSIGEGDVYKLVVNKENSDSDVSDDVEKWRLIVELTNLSSNFIYLYVDGEQTEIIGSGKVYSYSKNIINQSESLVEVKNADGIVLSSKKVSKDGNFIETIKDPVFTITKIVLNKWSADNLWDDPDPWFEVKVGDNVVGRSIYKPDVEDGSVCTFSDLSITVDEIYSQVSFVLWDHDTGYSSAGSTYISGLQTTNFSKYWRKDSFTMSISDLEFTVYGTWK